MALNLTGLASGVDTDAIVTQLMAMERQKLTRYRLKESAVQGRDTALKDVRTRLEAVKSTVAALRDSASWAETQKIESSDATKLGGVRTGAITPGTYSVEVQRLAELEQRTFSFTKLSTASEITLARAGNPDVVIDLAANATASDAAAAINAATGAFATAIVTADGKLQLTSKQSGGAGTFTATGSSTSDGLLGGAGPSPISETSRRAGIDAEYTVNGQAKTSATNAPEDGIAGMRLALRATMTAPVTLTVGNPERDVSALKDKAKAFVDAYNSALTAISQRTSEKRVANPSTSIDAAKGQLYGDSTMIGIASALRAEVAKTVAGNPATLDQLADLGIDIVKATGTAASPEARLGKLVFDEAKFTAAVETDVTGVQRFFGALTGTPGFAQKIEALLDRHVDSSLMIDGEAVKGTIPSRLDASTREVAGLREQMTAAEKRIEAKEKRLRAQFAAMEKAMSVSQTQQSWLAGQLAGLQSS